MAQNTKFHMIVGTYTSEGKSEGLYVYDFDALTAEIKFKTLARTGSPSYFTLTPDKRFLYSVSENDESSINAFAFDAKTGGLKFLNSVPSGGSGPTYISVDDQAKYVFAANYGGGSVTAVPIEKDGKLGADIQDIKHQGKSILKDKPFVHSAVLSPDNRYLFVADLGTDKVNIYNYDPAKRPKPLSQAEMPFVILHPGAGPRHSVFHPQGNYYYVVSELSSHVAAYRYQDGKLEHLHTLPLLPEGYSGQGSAADVQVSSDGRFLYANTRAVINEISIFSIDGSTGRLTQVGRHSTMGEKPRTFTIDPTGNWLLVANQRSNSINVLRRDQKTGLLSPSGITLSIDQPSLVRFVPVK